MVRARTSGPRWTTGGHTAMLLTLAAGWALLGTLVMAVAVASDARNRGNSPWGWFVLVLAFSIFGALAYLVLRGAERLEEEVVESEPAAEPLAMPSLAGVGAAVRWPSEAPARLQARPESLPLYEPEYE